MRFHWPSSPSSGGSREPQVSESEASGPSDGSASPLLKRADGGSSSSAGSSGARLFQPRGWSKQDKSMYVRTKMTFEIEVKHIRESNSIS